MSFSRNVSTNFQLEVPGARWLKADLHVHTIDDHPGGSAKLPETVTGNPEDSATIKSYARAFLQAAVNNGVKVLGLTPHSPRMHADRNLSCVWAIVNEWNEGIDDDGTPFRDKVYAVFPGFEPSLNEGKKGLHLLFLFDPEIGRDAFMSAFDLLMGGVSPWQDNRLSISSRNAGSAFEELKRFHKRDNDAGGTAKKGWNYLVLAPHIDAENGLLGGLKAQVLQHFPHSFIRGLELSDDKLPSESLDGSRHNWLGPAMEKQLQAFFHGSDAYTVEHLGRRHVWVKLASPRIEALRQAFIASESRIRIGFERDDNGDLQEIAKPPDITVTERPWLRSVTVRGDASFFGKSNRNADDGNRLEFSPDLTCIIGGSMTGKSTLLDGLRVYIDAPLPDTEQLRSQVSERGRNGFLAGTPEVEIDCPGSDPTEGPYERWPAVFYTQNELQRLADETEAVEQILARLSADETPGIEQRWSNLKQLDQELHQTADSLQSIEAEESEAQQALHRSEGARADLNAYSEAGGYRLNQVSQHRKQWEDFRDTAGSVGQELQDSSTHISSLEPPTIDEDVSSELKNRFELSFPDESHWKQIIEHLRSAEQELTNWREETSALLEALGKIEDEAKTDVERALAKRGHDASRIKEFQSISRQASLIESRRANLKEVQGHRAKLEDDFNETLKRREEIVENQRAAFDRVMHMIESDFEGHLRVRRLECGVISPLTEFLQGLGQRGITRWWNELEADRRPSPQELLKHLENGTLDQVGMSSSVQETFTEQMPAHQKQLLAAVRCPDLYVLEERVSDDPAVYRPLDSLSGGRRVSVLLSLLLRTSDERPLVIDQPEDQLDNAFLFQTVLPALKSLKGHRQIIVATHNANIVVNGDADQVIQLEASGSHGHPAVSGAIEDSKVRDAIVRTVDGGDEAFRLRRIKYGF